MTGISMRAIYVCTQLTCKHRRLGRLGLTNYDNSSFIHKLSQNERRGTLLRHCTVSPSLYLFEIKLQKVVNFVSNVQNATKVQVIVFNYFKFEGCKVSPGGTRLAIYAWGHTVTVGGARFGGARLGGGCRKTAVVVA